MREVKVLDFDGTIFSKNAIHMLIRVKRYILPSHVFFIWFISLLLKAPIFWYLHKKDSTKFNQFLYKHYKNLSIKQLNKFALNNGIRFIRDHIFTESLEIINSSNKVIIVSANLKIFLVPFFARLGIPSEYVIANSLEFIDGICTGKIVGNIIDNEEKGKCVKEIRRMFPKYKIYAYGNSKWDYPMLKLADQAFCINASIKLLKYFQAHSLLITPLYWQNLFFKLNFLHCIFATKVVAQYFTKKFNGHKINAHGSIIIANHQSYLDHYLLYNVIENYNACFIAKKEHFKSKIGKFYHSLARAIPIDRESPTNGMKSLLIAKSALLLGLNIIIYPEGTRSYNNKLGEFKKGFIKLANFFPEIKVTPVTINNSYQILKKGSYIPNIFKKADITIHPPITLKRGFDENLIIKQFSNIIGSVINE